ncbi:hypothetical protein, partial [Mycobacterium sp.]|uniref:hypothetical protein n=1 Tax=Mycobacterium sp. TaxID=1785 RepID=UPI003D146955
PPDGATILGEAHPNAKLTEEMVRHIRTLRRHGASYTELAGMFGVSDDHRARRDHRAHLENTCSRPADHRADTGERTTRDPQG